jgi:hypothetical protein
MRAEANYGEGISCVIPTEGRVPGYPGGAREGHFRERTVGFVEFRELGCGMNLSQVQPRYCSSGHLVFPELATVVLCQDKRKALNF